MMNKWLFGPYDNYVSPDTDLCSQAFGFTMCPSKFGSNFMLSFSSGCPIDEKETFTYNAERLLESMEDSDEKHFQPAKNQAKFLELAKELDKCDRSLLEQLHALYEGKRFTGAHRRTFEQVRLGERMAKKAPAAAVDGDSDEECAELVMAVGQVTPSESQKTDMLQNIKSQSKSKSTAKRLRALPMSQSLQTAAEEMARAIGSITTIGIPRPKEQLTEQQLELREKMRTL